MKFKGQLYKRFNIILRNYLNWLANQQRYIFFSNNQNFNEYPICVFLHIQNHVPKIHVLRKEKSSFFLCTLTELYITLNRYCVQQCHLIKCAPTITLMNGKHVYIEPFVRLNIIMIIIIIICSTCIYVPYESRCLPQCLRQHDILNRM